MPLRRRGDGLAHAYAHDMEHFGCGEALFQPISGGDMCPPCVGYRDLNGSWNKICDISWRAPDNTLRTAKGGSQVSLPDGFKPLERPPVLMERVQIEWRPRASQGVRQVGIDGHGGTPNAAPIPVGADAHVRYKSKSKFGAVLIAAKPVTETRYNDETLFREWLQKNRGMLAALHGNQLRRYGLWVVTATYVAPSAWICAWRDKDKEAMLSGKVKANMLGDDGLSLDWTDKLNDKDWSHYDDGPSRSGVVCFFDGYHFPAVEWWWESAKGLSALLTNTTATKERRASLLARRNSVRWDGDGVKRVHTEGESPTVEFKRMSGDVPTVNQMREHQEKHNDNLETEPNLAEVQRVGLTDGTEVREKSQDSPPLLMPPHQAHNEVPSDAVTEESIRPLGIATPLGQRASSRHVSRRDSNVSRSDSVHDTSGAHPLHPNHLTFHTHQPNPHDRFSSTSTGTATTRSSSVRTQPHSSGAPSSSTSVSHYPRDSKATHVYIATSNSQQSTLPPSHAPLHTLQRTAVPELSYPKSRRLPHQYALPGSIDHEAINPFADPENAKYARVHVEDKPKVRTTRYDTWRESDNTENGTRHHVIPNGRADGHTTDSNENSMQNYDDAVERQDFYRHEPPDQAEGQERRGVSWGQDVRDGKAEGLAASGTPARQRSLRRKTSSPSLRYPSSKYSQVTGLGIDGGHV